MQKQRKESSSIFKDQNRIDLAEQEDAQAKIISEFLPKQLSREEIELSSKDKARPLAVSYTHLTLPTKA